MNVPMRVLALSSKMRVALHLLAAVVLLNYVAQIPYYIHFYGVRHVAPNYLGTGIFLVATLALFLVGYLLTLRAYRAGGWLLLLFLVLEFVGYLLHNLAGAFLKDLPLSDPLFLTVSLLGYLNFVGAFVFILIMMRYHRQFFFWPRLGTRDQGPMTNTHSGLSD